MYQRKFWLFWVIILVAVIGGGRKVLAVYTSQDYLLDEATINPFAGNTDSADYQASVNGTSGLTGGQSDNNYLGAGPREQAVLPTPPAPTLTAESETVGTLRLVVNLGANDPAVLVEMLLTDDQNVSNYYNSSGEKSNINTWILYRNLGGQAGVLIKNLDTNRHYSVQVRFKLDDATVSELSNSSASVKPLTKGEVVGGGLVNKVINTVKKVLQNDTVQRIITVISSILVPVTAAALIAQVSSIGVLFFQFLIELINRILGGILSGLQYFAFYKKKKVFGLVIDGHNRHPILGVQLTLLDPSSKRVLDTQITDEDGRYYFLYDERTSYQILTSSEHYEPFSKTVRGNVNFTIRLGVKLEYDLNELQRRRFFNNMVDRINYFRTLLLFIGVLCWTFIFFFGQRNWAAYALGTYYVLALIIELYVRRQPRPYGVVEDATTGQTLSMVVVRIADLTGALVQTLICDEQGRFKTLIRPSNYNFSFSKQGYQTANMQNVKITRSIHSLAVTAKLIPAANISPTPTNQPPVPGSQPVSISPSSP